MHTLQQMLGQPTDEPMTMNQRHTYIDIAKPLTAPLLNAYSEMIDINIRSHPTNPTQEVDQLPHLPLDTHTEVDITNPSHPEYSLELTSRIQELENTFVQNDTLCNPGPNLYEARAHIRDNPSNIFTISDAAFECRNADVTP
jgi:hypothetical protein